MRGGKPVLLPNWWSPPRPASRPRRGRQRSRKPGPRAPLRAVVVTQIYWLRCRRVAGLTRGTARVCLGEALGSRPAWNTIREAISRDTPSGPHRLHAFRKNRTRSAAGTSSAVTASAVGGRRICRRKCGCRVASLSPTTSGSSTVEEHARGGKSKVLSTTRTVSLRNRNENRNQQIHAVHMWRRQSATLTPH